MSSVLLPDDFDALKADLDLLKEQVAILAGQLSEQFDINRALWAEINALKTPPPPVETSPPDPPVETSPPDTQPSPVEPSPVETSPPDTPPVETSPPDPPPGIVFPPTDHPYFDWLTGHPKRYKAYSLRDQAQLVEYKNANSLPPAVNYLYPNDPDPRAQDAAKVVVDTTSNSLKNQVWLPIESGDGRPILITWDAWFGKECQAKTSGLSNWKTFQVRRSATSPALWLETRTRFDKAPTTADLAWLDYRAYSTLGPNVTNAQPLAPAMGMTLKPETWIRYWLHLSPTAGDWDLVSAWAADPTTPPRQTINGLQLESYGYLHSFQLEFNTSTDYVKLGRPDLVAYVRNVVMLRDVPLGDVPSLLVQP